MRKAAAREVEDEAKMEGVVGERRNMKEKVGSKRRKLVQRREGKNEVNAL